LKQPWIYDGNETVGDDGWRRQAGGHDFVPTLYLAYCTGCPNTSILKMSWGVFYSTVQFDLKACSLYRVGTLAAIITADLAAKRRNLLFIRFAGESVILKKNYFTKHVAQCIASYELTLLGQSLYTSAIQSSQHQ
jgi:hypothetical protein